MCDNTIYFIVMTTALTDDNKSGPPHCIAYFNATTSTPFCRGVKSDEEYHSFTHKLPIRVDFLA